MRELKYVYRRRDAQWEHFQKKWPETLFSQNQEIKIFTQETRKKSYIFWNISNF